MKGISSPDQVPWPDFPIWDRASPKRPDVLELLFRDGEYLNPERTATLSRSTGYALMALVHLAAQPAGRLTGAREIAAATGAPMPFLWKILRQLSERKLTRSSKGVHGGYELARPANLIALSQVIKLTQRQNPATRCFLGVTACDAQSPCVLHANLAGLRENIQTVFDQTTIADLIPETKMRRSSRRSRTTNQSTQG